MQQTRIDQASVYTDLTAVQNLRASSVGKEEAIEASARQFESFLVSMMIKSMRQVNAVFEEGNPFHGNGSKIFQDMMDQQLSLSFTQKRGLGLAQQLVGQMRQQGHLSDENTRSKALADLPAQFAVPARTLSAMPAHQQAPQRQDLNPESREARTLAMIERLQPESAAPPLAGKAPVSEQFLSGDARDLTASGSVPIPQFPDQMSGTAEDFPDADAFVRKLYPVARRVGEELGVDPSVLLAQAALETGWGRHPIRGAGGEPSFNLFGIKADARWEGDSVGVATTEYSGGQAMRVQADFRAYDDYEASFRDYLSFIQSQPRYQGALAQADDPAAWSTALQEAGYATDPAYAEKIQRIHASERLHRARLEWQQTSQTPADRLRGGEQ